MIRFRIALAAFAWIAVVTLLAVHPIPQPDQFGRLRQTAHVRCVAGSWCY